MCFVGDPGAPTFGTPSERYKGVASIVGQTKMTHKARSGYCNFEDSSNYSVPFYSVV